MKIEAFSLCEEDEPWIGLRGARGERPWLPAYAYRCLPLKIANSAGVELYAKHHVVMKWNGRDDLEAIEIRPENNEWCVSHFGHGVVSFSIPYLFKTPAGWGLWVTGPANEPHDGIAPLEGIIETNWSPYTFTMNWRMTAVDLWVTFTPGEAIARIVPVKIGLLQSIHLIEREKLEMPVGKMKEYVRWWGERNEFLKKLGRHDPSVAEMKYHKGTYQRAAKVKGLKSVKVE
jgi:hypothetical protein